MKKSRLCLLCAIGFIWIVGCGTDQEDCISAVEPCGVTMDYVCGCDDVTYVNPSAAECHQIYTYTEGVCDERSDSVRDFYDEQYVTTPYGDSMNAERHFGRWLYP